MWEKQHEILAAAPGFEGWYVVSGAASHITDVGRRAGQANLRRGSKVGADDLPEDFLMFGVIQAEIALEVLRDYARTPSYKSERVRELQQLMIPMLEDLKDAEYQPRRENRAERRARQKKRNR